jgi:hypothetical protein
VSQLSGSLVVVSALRLTASDSSFSLEAKKDVARTSSFEIIPVGSYYK